jgi:hypothetical protein
MYNSILHVQIEIGESIKYVRHTSYSNISCGSRISNLSFMAAYSSNCNYGCWIFDI